MKGNIFRKSFFIIGLCLLLASCSDDDNSGDRLGFIEASLDGQHVESISATGSIVKLSNDVEGLSISGLEDPTNTGSKLLNVWFRIPEVDQLDIKNYIFNQEGCLTQNTVVCGWLHYQEDDANISSSTLPADQGGELMIQITSLDYRDGGHVKGEYSGALIDDINGSVTRVTNGSFDVVIED